jgi:adenosylhomocysteine nucleosidase
VGSNNTGTQKLSEPAGTLVCFAVKEEVAPFQEFAKGNSEISILLTGIGQKNARDSLTKFLSTNTPKLVLTCGFAGGLNPALVIGDVVFYTIEEDLRAALLAAGAKTAEFFCAGRIATTVAEKKAWRDETGCDVVEMESEAIFKMCYERQIPSATVRVISDTANEDLPLDFNALMTPEQTISYPRLAVALLKSPEKVPRLIELQRNTRFASEKLAGVLSSLLRSLNSRA